MLILNAIRRRSPIPQTTRIKPTPPPTLTRNYVLQETKEDNKYLFFITDGDSWLSQRRWHNAIFQYKKALEIKPGNYDALYRLSMAYSFRCVATGVNCEEGKALVKRLQAYQPADPNIEDLWALLESVK